MYMYIGIDIVGDLNFDCSACSWDEKAWPLFIAQ